ncbi:MAG TPA: hypothetical protein VLJ37_02280 [bacterium]|nr:hypothetical protein [bacterium]
MPSLPLELSAQLFASAALRAGAVSSFVFDATFAVLKPESAGAGTIIPTEEAAETLRHDFPMETVQAFLRDLAEGRLDGHRYDIANGLYATGNGGRPVFFDTSILLARQDPLASELKAERPAPMRKPVALTCAGVYLDNLPRIPADAFGEAVYRALGQKPARNGDLLWLHADRGELRGSTVTAAMTVSYDPPREASAKDYRTAPLRFPLVPLEMRHDLWEISPRHVIGSRAVRERVLDVLATTSWPLKSPRPEAHGKPRPPRAPRPAVPPAPPPVPAPPKREIAPPPPPPPKPRALPESQVPGIVADLFSQADKELVLKGRPGIIAITQPGISVASLIRIPEDFFRRAVRYCLGMRDPREGDRIAFTAGTCFSRGGRIRDCLFVTPQIPRSRSGGDYPKLWMEYRSGRWTILANKAFGKGSEELRDAVARLPWNLVQE